ncbi:MAG TPA: transketolase C-terminal domain-containing protein [Polyangia bacterium]|nr:transketolase C-terminal domain-containing protein [Polyangia bacterium]
MTAPAETYGDALRELVLGDPRVVVLTAENRAAIRQLPDQIGDRFIDVGICEQTMIGMAAGLAVRGRIPVVHALATFLTLRAFEFIRDDVGIAGLPVKLVGGVPGFLSEANGPTHQAIDDLAVMRAIPGMHIFCPADASELLAGLPAVLTSPSPTYIRFNASPSRLHHAPFELGWAEVLGEGNDLGVVSAGLLVPYVKEACDLLRGEGIQSRLLNLRTVAPLDEEAIAETASRCPLLLVVEDHLLVGGIYQQVCEVLVRRRLSVPVVPFGLPGRWFKPALLADVLDHEGFSAAKLAERMRQAHRSALARSTGRGAPDPAERLSSALGGRSPS